ncbi:MAG TPA: amino acid aminotransferase [Parachlamydiales bacterium]|nr:amino acid aminotransferase [Parachlamydiales bacterium]
MSYHFINDAFVTDDKAQIPLGDLGLTRGMGVCDIMRTYRKKPFHLHDHLIRLAYSAKEVGLELPKSFEAIEALLLRLLERAPSAESTLRILLTGGESRHRFLADRKASLFISAMPLTLFSEEFYTQGVSVSTTTLERPFPKSKTLFYLPAALAVKEGERWGAFEALYLNEKREILEGGTSNFFAFKNEALITPGDERILHGITRALVLRLAKEHFPIEIRPIPYEEIQELDEALIVSTTKEVLPVTLLDGCPIGKGTVGEKTKKMMRLFKAYVENGAWPPLKISRHEETPASVFG